MDIGLLIPSAGRSTAPPSSSALSENGQSQPPTQSGPFSALLKDAAQNTYDEQTPPLSDADDPIDPAPSTEAGDHATGTALSGITVGSFFQARDLPEVASTVADNAESLQNSTGLSLQSYESTPLLPQGLGVGVPYEDGTLGQDPAPTDPPQPRTTDSLVNSLLQPALDHKQLSVTPATQEGSRALDVPPIRNGRGAPVDLEPVPFEQLTGDSALLSTLPPRTSLSDQGPSPVMQNQGARNFPPTVYVNGDAQLLNRPSTGIQPSAIVQAQGTQETSSLAQSILIPVIGEFGWEGQDPLGGDGQGAGEGAFFYSGESGGQESMTRGSQSPFFIGQFTSAGQAQPSPQGGGSSVVTPASDHLKMTQTLLGENHSTTMTSASGKAQTVHLELPSHDSGPLSVRISMTDQTVHTQFTTDRNDLGALLMGRQDQLQQNLTKSGLELGQFQVHIDQQGQQEAFQDRQARRNGGTSEHQSASQDHNQEAQDRERPNHRPPRTLSLFA